MSVLRFEAVSRDFDGRMALHRMTLEFPGGESTCLIGANGAGKSTALALAAGLLIPSSGRIFVGNAEMRQGETVPGLSFLPQRSAFPALMQVGEILELCRAVRRLPRSSLDEILWVTGIEPILGLRAGELSGGWMRRLGLAAALTPSADLLLLDEPFAGLDPDTVQRLLFYLQEKVCAGATLVLASHEFELIDQLFPRRAVLDEGSLRALLPWNGRASREVYRQVLSRAAVPTLRKVHAT